MIARPLKTRAAPALIPRHARCWAQQARLKVSLSGYDPRCPFAPLNHHHAPFAAVAAEGAAFGPDALKATGQAFDAAWAEIEGNFGNVTIDARGRQSAAG